ncbi:C1D-domain-containing protein [Macrolepiota fuliginosa MF-IS2]|uniref:Exosome complex protein n=1 Tax=Macrolepiota fuliginosa MF-IS2 TaxID=1400762 RepID=A0A9P6C4L1_9AGAR|nr:C1D-domain-containing protein [Macrolepiota fuliginosa MF-IS2]
MANETNKVKAKLVSLNASLGELETLLEPLLAQSLPETIIGLEPMQQAKLQTVLPYIVYDLIFIYLKTKGVAPGTHPVVPELDRVRQYFEKISNAENPPTRRIEMDKEAAGRFIKHAISQAVTKSGPEPAPTQPSISVPTKVTTKMIARAQYEHTLEKERQGQDEVEDELKVYGESDSDSSNGSGAPTTSDSKQKINQPVSSKRRRQPMDPFAGYGDKDPVTAESSSKRLRRNSQNAEPKETHDAQPLGDSTVTTVSANRKPKKKKKAKKAQE